MRRVWGRGGVKNRKGFTLILMAFMMTALLGAAALGVDVGRMELYRAQLHTAADAAALAAAQRVMAGASNDANAAAIDFATRHKVGNTTIQAGWVSVTPGIWTSAGGFVPAADWTVAGVNAVRTSIQYTGQYGFARAMGLSTHDVAASADAVSAGVGATSCVKPVAIPYQILLDQIYPPTGSPAVHKPTSYNLTEADIDALHDATAANEIELKAGAGGGNNQSGNFYLLQLGPYSHADKVPLSPSPTWDFPNQFGGNCSQSPWTIGPGDWLQGKQGNDVGKTKEGIEDLCGVSLNNSPATCTSPLASRRIKMVMWADSDNSVCTPRCYQVKYVGAFVVTRASNDSMLGYFEALTTDGALTTVPSPLQKLALVR